MLRVHVCQCGWDQVFVCMSSVSSCTDASLCVCMPTWLCTYIVVVYIQYVRLCLRDSALRARVCVCMYSGCLGAWRAGGALQGGLREASGEGSDAGVCQGGGREQLIPAADCGRQVQVLQEDLGHSHEALVVHTPVIPPHYYLEEKWQQFFFFTDFQCCGDFSATGRPQIYLSYNKFTNSIIISPMKFLIGA